MWFLLKMSNTWIVNKVHYSTFNLKDKISTYRSNKKKLFIAINKIIYKIKFNLLFFILKNYFHKIWNNASPLFFFFPSSNINLFRLHHTMCIIKKMIYDLTSNIKWLIFYYTYCERVIVVSMCSRCFVIKKNKAQNIEYFWWDFLWASCLRSKEQEMDLLYIVNGRKFPIFFFWEWI